MTISEIDALIDEIYSGEFTEYDEHGNQFPMDEGSVSAMRENHREYLHWAKENAPAEFSAEIRRIHDDREMVARLEQDRQPYAPEEPNPYAGLWEN